MAVETGRKVGEVHGGPLFQRRSSGLVREAGVFDTLIYNIQFITPGLAIAILFQLQPSFYPGLNMYASLLIAVALILPTTLVFAMLGAAIPRSGADYVWGSRIFHPGVGAMTSVGFTALWLIYNGLPASFIASLGLSPLFRQIGIETESARMLRLADWFATPTGQFVVGAVAIAIFIGIFTVGLRLFFRVQNAMFAFVTFGLVLTAIFAGFMSIDELRNGINDAFGWRTESDDTYGALLADAQEGGFARGEFAARDTLLGMTWVYLTFAFGVSSAYIGSEIQRARRVQLWSMPAAVIYAMIWALIFIWLMSRMGALDFIGAVGFLGGGEAFGAPPTVSEILGYAMPLGVAILIGVAFVFWMAGPLPNQMLNTSRNLLAYGLDGLMPRKLAEVHPRTHTPVINLLFVMVVSWIFLALLQFTEIFSTLAFFLAYTLTFLVASLSAVVLPFRRKDIFEGSPVRRRIGGVPVISIVGLLAVAGQAVFIWAFLWDPLSGLTGNPELIAYNLIVFFGGILVYLLAKAYWRRRKYDLDANYRELPVE